METETFNAGGTSRDWVTKWSIRLYRYRTLLRRRWWLVALGIGLGLVYNGWILFTTPTTFHSEGKLMVSPKLATANANQFVEDQGEFYGNQLQILREPQVHERAERRLQLENPDLVGRVQIDASLQPRSSIFLVEATGTNADYTRKYVDAWMAEFIADKREKLGDATGEVIGSYREEKELRLRARDAAQKAFDDYKEKHGIGFWEEQSRTAANSLNVQRSRQSALSAELNRLKRLSSKDLLNSSQPGNTMAGGDLNESGSAAGGDLAGLYLRTRQDLVELEAQISERSQVWKPKHPRLIAMQDQASRMQRQLDTIVNQNEELRKTNIATKEAELESVAESIKQLEPTVLEASRKDAEYKRLEDTAQRSRAEYEKMVEDIQSLGLGDKLSRETMQIWRPASPAVGVPKRPWKRLLTGVILGFLGSAALLILLDRADDRFASPSEVMERFSESILGQIPNAAEQNMPSGLQLLRADDDRYMFAESFRSLRSSLIFLPNQAELRTLLVTSAIPGEGKSTCASNLAVTMALAGARVLLVDADLRRGDLANLFDVDGRTGLSNVLRSEIEWQKATRITNYATLTLLPRGPVTNQSGELLLVPTFDTLMAEWKEAFDLVIFNTSPILATDDTTTIAPHFDGTLMIARAQFTSARLVQNSLNALYQRQVNVLGLVLNCVDAEMPDYYYYRYPKYYAA